MRSKINIAEGIRAKHLLEGEGEAQKILQEANSLCESLRSIGDTIEASKVGGDSKALRLRLSEQYLEALSEILQESNVLMTPKEGG